MANPYSRLDTIQRGNGVFTIATFIDGGFQEVYVTLKTPSSALDSCICVFQHYNDTPIVYRMYNGKWYKERELSGESIETLTDSRLCSLV